MDLQDRETSFDGIPVWYWEGGEGLPILMLHGSGPGASSHGNWRLVINDLADRFHIYAPDLIGFGRSGRRPAPPYFDFDFWVAQARAMMDLIGAEKIGIIGHSLSGALALRLAATDPRVSRVLTTGSIGSRFVANEDTIRVWSFPETREDLIKAGQCLVYDHGLIDDAYIAGREKVLYDGQYKDYFNKMFEGDKQAYLDKSALSPEELSRVTCDVLMVHGRDDRPTPFEESTLKIARHIPQADVVALGRCGHSVALEHPDKLLSLASRFFV